MFRNPAGMHFKIFIFCLIRLVDVDLYHFVNSLDFLLDFEVLMHDLCHFTNNSYLFKIYFEDFQICYSDST